MHLNQQSNHEFILGFLCAIAIAATVAIFFSFDNLSTTLWSQEAAGWAQAIGTVLAIFGAFQISSRQYRLSRKAGREDSLRKAKVLVQFVVPALKTIEADVGQATLFCNRYKNIGVRNLAEIDFAQLTFRPISSTEFILDNAHNLPDDLGTTITQLLGFHAVVDTNLRLLIERGLKTKYIDGFQLGLLLKWLALMQQLIDEIFEKIPDLHDQPLSEQIKNLAP